MADLLRGAPLFRNNPDGPSQQVTSDELNKKVVCLFFGAKEAGKELNDKLKAFYEKTQPQGFEVVYISHDNSEDEMKQFLKSHPKWLFIKYGDPRAISLLQRYQLKAIPSLIVVQRGGTPLVGDALNDIYSKPPQATFDKWRKATTE
ncbi:unnamed protein product [Bursaphelenchus xylophilus]|uniref:(pine wood nematode) hypothetical protein n=1 Tax=Bursaphelenchus xylophilus TaxID=6326 RepID=A0A1I7S821_BURXY|nr:unnamed protein product [Bursaphelenchus xylophilus]CAG9080673.1 unnamed protein product [Bursaphelenchus xylophilus]